jgi:hypothetical protein
MDDVRAKLSKQAVKALEVADILTGSFVQRVDGDVVGPNPAEELGIVARQADNGVSITGAGKTIENINDAVFQATDVKPEYDMADMHRCGPFCLAR